MVDICDTDTCKCEGRMTIKCFLICVLLHGLLDTQPWHQVTLHARFWKNRDFYVVLPKGENIPSFSSE